MTLPILPILKIWLFGLPMLAVIDVVSQKIQKIRIEPVHANFLCRHIFLAIAVSGVVSSINRLVGE